MTGEQLRAPSVVVVGAGFGGLAAAESWPGAPVDVHARRPAQLPHLPAAALPGGHGRPERRRRGLPGAGHPAPRRQPRLPAGRGGAASTGRPPTCCCGPVPTGAPVRTGCRSTTSWWPPAPCHDASASPARPSTASRSTRSPTPSACATTCSSASRPPTPILACSTTASSPSSSWAADRPAWRSAGALAELCRTVLRKDFADLDVGRARVVLVEMADRLLAPFHASSSRHAVESLRARGVDVRTGTTVEAVTGSCVPAERRHRGRHAAPWCGRPGCRPPAGRVPSAWPRARPGASW